MKSRYTPWKGQLGFIVVVILIVVFLASCRLLLVVSVMLNISAQQTLGEEGA
jgi:competence protein ComGC